MQGSFRLEVHCTIPCEGERGRTDRNQGSSETKYSFINRYWSHLWVRVERVGSHWCEQWERCGGMRVSQLCLSLWEAYYPKDTRPWPSLKPPHPLCTIALISGYFIPPMPVMQIWSWTEVTVTFNERSLWLTGKVWRRLGISTESFNVLRESCSVFRLPVGDLDPLNTRLDGWVAFTDQIMRYLVSSVRWGDEDIERENYREGSWKVGENKWNRTKAMKSATDDNLELDAVESRELIGASH